MTQQEHRAGTRTPGRRVLVVGLGKTGLSCVRHLSRQGMDVAVTDSRLDPPGLEVLKRELPDVALFVGGFDEQAFQCADEVVLSPGVSVSEPMVADAAARGVPVVGDIELFARAATAPVVGVTGSNGKSTVTSMFGLMAQHSGLDTAIGGNIGTPALELLGETEPALYVLELSSFQLETTRSLNPQAATVLNISPDHIDRHGSVDAYAESKARIFNGDGVMVLNADDPVVMAMNRSDREVILFGLSEPDDGMFGLRVHDHARWLAYGTDNLLPVSELRVRGEHNHANALAALALGYAMDLPTDAMLTALREFPGLAHRTQWVAEHEGVQWYNDSKGTNVGATMAAVAGMPGKVVLIAGGQAKGADFSPLREVVGEKARAVVVLGQDAELIKTALRGAAPVLHVADMEAAVDKASELAVPGDTVLLSPACASFDMFSGYEERGNAFMDAVRRLQA